MLSITLGPLAFPLPPLMLLAALVLATVLARRLAPPALASSNENSVWLAAVLGLVAARAAHVLRHAEAYAATPWAVLDIRDGGWVAGPGLVVAALVLLWRADRLPQARRALAIGAGSGLASWAVFNGALALWQPPASARELPPDRVARRPADGRQPLGHLVRALPRRDAGAGRGAARAARCALRVRQPGRGA
jgi:hypothetical protein